MLENPHIFLVKTGSDKKRDCERLEKQPLNFFTVYNKYRNLSSFFNSQSTEMERSGMEAD